jgi:hypothetical protein
MNMTDYPVLHLDRKKTFIAVLHFIQSRYNSNFQLYSQILSQTTRNQVMVVIVW